MIAGGRALPGSGTAPGARLRERLGPGAIIAIGVLLAWSQRFVLDDAFISLRYAANFVHGEGLVFNPGERVEGYSNFLWTLWLTLPARFAWDPEPFLYTTGLVATALSLLATLHLARTLLGPGAALLAGLLTAANPTFAAFATGGLETPWQTLAVTAATAWAASLTARRPSLCGDGPFGHAATIPERGLRGATEPRGWRSAMAARVGWSLLAALGVLTRMDTALLLAPALIFLLTRPIGPGIGFVAHATHPRKGLVARAAALLLPGGLVLAGWMLWRHDVYGAWLPNTYVVKTQVPGGWSVWLTHGSLYLAGWLLGYGWALVAAGVAWQWRAFRIEAGDRGVVLLVWPLALWFAYVVRIGGDFMEYRLLAPVTPFVAILGAWVACRIPVPREPPRIRRIGIVFVAALVALAWLSSATFGRSPFSDRVETLAGLRSHLDRTNPLEWRMVGRVLAEQLAGAGASTGDTEGDGRRASPAAAAPVWIAVTAAGAVPYASELPTVDMLGLCDAWVARHGRPYTDRAGHRIIAPLRYLTDRGVHLVIAHPVAGQPTRRAGYRLLDLDPYAQVYTDPESLPARCSIVEMPLPSGATLAMIYLTPHPRVDALVASGRWIQSPLLDAQ